MYPFIWSRLPGPRRLRAALAIVVVAGIGVLLWYVVFPAIDEWLPVDGTVTGWRVVFVHHQLSGAEMPTQVRRVGT